MLMCRSSKAFRLGLSVSGPAVRRKCQRIEPLEHVVPVAFRARVAAGGKVAATDLGHPAGACKVALRRLSSPLGFVGGVDAYRMRRAISSLPSPSLSASRRRM